MPSNEWFYEPARYELRLGDIVTGYTSVVPCFGIDSGAADAHLGELSSITLVKETYAVVLTPCCSIEGKTLVLGALERVRPIWFENPFLSEDFLRMDQPMYPKDSIPPDAWAKLSSTDQATKEAVGPAWSYLEYFAFPSGGVLPPYSTTLKGRQYETDYYVVDFRRPVQVKHNYPQSEGHACGNKVLQLSSQGRNLLRSKISYYYFRPPAEDCELSGADRVVAGARQG